MADVKTPKTEGVQPDLASIFVGRARELQQLLQIASAESAVALVKGEAGIGKSRLISEFTSQVEHNTQGRTRCLLAYCPPLSEPFPMGPIIDALRRAGDKHIERLHLSDLAGVLRPVFPEWASLLPPAPAAMDDPATVQHRLFRAFDELLCALDVGVLVVEDAHWADRTTLEFLLFRWSQPSRPGMLTLTYRPQEVSAPSLLRKFETRSPTGARRLSLSLESLSAAEIRDLVLHILGTGSVSDEFANFLHHHTGGVPFVLEETLNLLRDRGDIVRRDDAWVRRTVEDLAVPATVGASIMERVERLARAAGRILEAAAVLGRTAGEESLRAVSGLNAGQAQQGLEKATASGLLIEVAPGRFELRHALAGRSIYETLPDATRRRMHKRAACILEKAKSPPVADLARHLKHAGELRRWAGYAEQSAEHAVTTGDDRTAALLLHEILNTVSLPMREQGRLGVKLARAGNWAGEMLAGEPLERIVRQLYELLEQDGLPEVERGRLRCKLGMLLLNHVDPRRGVEEIERSVGELEHAPALAMRALNLLCKPWISMRPADERRVWLERVVSLLPRVTDAAERAALTMDCAIQQLELDPTVGWDTVERRLVQAEADIKVAGRKRLLASNYSNLAYMAMLWGRQERVEVWLKTLRRLIEATAFRMIQSELPVNCAWLRYYTGRWTGLAEAVAGIDIEELKQAGCLEVTLLQGLIALAGGDVRAGEDALRSVLRDYRGPTRFNIVMVVSAALGRLYLDQNRPEKALELTRETVETLAAAELWPWMADIMPVHVDALARAGETAAARTLVGDFERGLHGYDAPAAFAALLVCRAHVAAASDEHAAAAELYAGAACAWAALPRPYDELLAAERHASNLLIAGERERALELLMGAERRLLELGARRDADRIARLLREHDVEIKRTWRCGRKGYGAELSPREREVISLIAEGNTNKAIAKRLFLSPATVASHAASAMRKFGVSSRTALVSAASEIGLPGAG